MSRSSKVVLRAVCSWIARSDYIRSAVLFGSSALGGRDGNKYISGTSDIDIHIITSSLVRMRNVNWAREMPELEYCMDVWRPASGGVSKVTIIYLLGQIDLVIVPSKVMTIAKCGIRIGFHRGGALRAALNEMATCLRGGYEFLKGEPRWGQFYHNVSQLPGVRLSDMEVETLAKVALCDGLWVLQKLSQGEVIASQHVLHSRLVDTNLRLWREHRLREALPLPSFGLGRRVERLTDDGQLACLLVSCPANVAELENATRNILAGLQVLTRRLIPTWHISARMAELLNGPGPTSPHP